MTAPVPPRPRPLVLCVVDGLGERAEREGNAVRLAATPTLDALATHPHTSLGASGPDIGLAKGQAGDGFLAHRVLGAGRVPPAPITRIDATITDATFRANPVIAQSVQIAKHHFSARLHLFGVLSESTAQASMKHLFEIIDAAAFEEVPVVVHAFLDGRDTPPRSAGVYLDRLEAHLDRGRKGAIGTIAGRSYALDRDGRWDRTQLVYNAIVRGPAPRVDRYQEALGKAYDSGKSDDLVEPTRIADYTGMKGSFMCDFNQGDRTWRWFGEENGLAWNLRGDGLRQLSAMFKRQNVPLEVEEKMLTDRDKPVIVFIKHVYATMTSYDPTLEAEVAFPIEPVPATFGEVIAEAGLTQLRCGESEKAPHVTRFFSGGREAAFTGEDRTIVPSPRDVPTFAKKPEMSAAEVAKQAVAAIEAGKHDFILVHFANVDAVAHTGDLVATTRAVEAVDAGLGAILAAVRAAGGALFVTAAHGNAEQMKDNKGQPSPANTPNAVPLYYVNESDRDAKLAASGRLADVAPTMLDLLGLPRPEAMTGRSLFER
ncbi:2,3-bisphosphoglycerate-independent phosphoglycerate mutase [Minicystis rosea]|nr:2,3-bisphosphoglycerate-independent phosphoglycerate mutase [Minicystis rosea]